MLEIVHALNSIAEAIKNAFGSGAVTLAYAERDAGQSGIIANTALTGLSITFEVPKGGRRVEIELWLSQVYSTVSADRADIGIKESSTDLAVAYGHTGNSGDGRGGAMVKYNGVMSAGSHTVFARIARGTGSGSISYYAGPEAKAYITARLV